MRQVSEPLQNCTDHPKGFPYPFERRKFEFEWPTKGQLISKCLFGVFTFSQKTNENKSAWGIIVVKSNLFVRFLGELRIPNSPFEINSPLATQLPCGVFSLSYLQKIVSQTILLYFPFLVLVYAKYQGVFLDLPENPFFIRVNSKWGDLWKWALWKIFCVVD